MTEIEQTIGNLTRAYPSLSPRVQQAAAFVLDHPSRVATRSMRGLAREAGVTPPTMVRMVKAIGFARYENFREIYRDGFGDIAPGYRDRVRDLQSRDAERRPAGLWRDLMTANQENLEILAATVQPETLTRAADRLLQARRVHVMGLLSSHSLAGYLHYVAGLALPDWNLVDSRGGMPAEEILRVGPKDAAMVIGFAPYAADTVRFAAVARARGAVVIVLTDALTSPLAAEADEAFIVPHESPQFFGSFVATLALIEALIAHVVQRGGAEVADNIAAVEALRKSLGHYHA